MKLNTPLPQPLPKECVKAARIFKSFVDHGKNGLDGVIPRTILENAKGFAIFTVFKFGFLFSARAGSGIVVAKLPDGSWSAPSAIGASVPGVGIQADAEATDFLIVLNTKSAIKTFMAAGSLRLGGNLSIALGPLGRNDETLGSLDTSGRIYAMYSYSKTKGLFGGISVEGSAIAEHQDTNTSAYHLGVSIKSLLSGVVPRPDWAQPLYQILDTCTKLRGGQREMLDNSPAQEQEHAPIGFSGPDGEQRPRMLQKKKKSSPPPFPPNWGEPTSDGLYFTDTMRDFSKLACNSRFESHFESDFNPQDDRSIRMRSGGSSLGVVPTPMSWRSFGSDLDKFYTSDDDSPGSRANIYGHPYPLYNRSRNVPHGPTMPPIPFDTELYAQLFDEPSPMLTKPVITPKADLTAPLAPGEGVGRAIALFDFGAVEPGDVSFSKGQVITIIQKTETTDGWWTGKVDGRSGTFPANFVEVV